MRDHLVKIFAANHALAHTLLDDVAPDRLTAEPHGIKSAAWVLGHLILGAGMVAQSLGKDLGMPPAWNDLFFGHDPAQASRYPSKAELFEAYDRAHRVIADALASVSDAQLTAPPADEKLRAYFPTLGFMAVYMLAQHEGYHLGQVSAWRRAAGLPPAKTM